MKTVGSRELKNRLGAYLKRVRRGEKLIVTDRGEPVAQLTPVEAEPSPEKRLDATLRNLAAQGLLRLATKPLKPIKPIHVKGKPLSQVVLEDRR